MNSKKGVLTKLAVGKSAVVCELYTKGNMRRRLQDMGIIEGSKINAVLDSAAGGIRAYEIRGIVVALRTKNSDEIIVMEQ